MYRIIANTFFLGKFKITVQKLTILLIVSAGGGERATAARETRKRGKGRKRLSLAVSGWGSHAVKRAREPTVLEVITLYIIADPLMWDRYL